MKKQTQILLCVMILLSEVASAQSSSLQRTWVFFHDKGTTTLQSTNPALLGISERALKRRAKVLPPDRLIDQLDLPVSEAVIAQIKQTGVKIRTVSRWFNAVSVEGTQQQIQSVNKLLPVAATEQVAVMKRPRPIPSSSIPPTLPLKKASGSQGLDYGLSATQLTNMKMVDLHAIGVTGTGVLIGMLDDGFNNYRIHNALKSIKVDSTYDFIHHIDDVSRQPWEDLIQGHHGAGTLSAVGGFEVGNMIGAAFSASFALGKTEIDSVEVHIEEDNYVAGLEWLERLGADIASSSLGYRQFDPSTYSYWHKDLDGRTTIVARAASIAARKGVLLVTAMGNDGYATGSGGSVVYADTTIVSPADADSIIAVGATSSDRELATFSGTGPTADGRIKPEVVAQGMAIYWAEGSTTTGYSYAQGTSCSTPLVAGAAALVLSAHPELTPMQVRQALTQTAVHINTGTNQTATYPNNYYGYGFVDALDAVLYWGLVFSNRPTVTINETAYVISTKIKSKTLLITDSLFLFYKKASAFAFHRVVLFATGTSDEYAASIEKTEIDSTSIIFFSARDNSGISRRNPYDAPNETFSIQPPNGMVYVESQSSNSVPLKFHLCSFPNPFNPSTTLLVDVPRNEEAEIAVFNILGQQVKTLFRGVIHSGIQQYHWDGIDERGVSVAAGIYIARLKTLDKMFSIKMLFLK